MSSLTQELLKSGGFSCKCHPGLTEDVRVAVSGDPSCWNDMKVILESIQRGSCRADDWNAPLIRKHADIGEIKMRVGKRLYRLYVHAPPSRPGVLYLLHFAWKRPGKRGLDTQDNQIDEAFNRLIAEPLR